ncbi:helix-turn-helix transcriptional regulator [Pedobacter sp. N36a]|uniref:winged helix-turn-helix transcriptional regulator n=1 Tax=Pedobacter sp. N36a TaxID=2767996 RepID=UPI001656A7F6|nr:helix-turn-helix domain-containing protein [Pedobacter sp. N36a]MBC8984388.1 helix-turn-helix transcriptional regulator [Pedobacter sp. N36a]
MRKNSSTNYENEQVLHDFCDAAYTLSVLSGRWKLTILVKLMEQDLRFGEIKQMIPKITERVLALQLKNLEQDQLILKIQHKSDPKAPVYRLSLKGKSLKPLINSLAKWGEKYK